MNRFVKIFALLAAGACVAGFAGCKKKAPDNRVPTSANWNVRVSTAVEKNSLEYWKTHKEVADYKVRFAPGSNKAYSLVYSPADANADLTNTYVTSGLYRTEFYMEQYDWSSTAESYKKSDVEAENVYVYKTTFSISGTYRLAGRDETKSFSDSVVSVCKFRTAGENLTPVYSYLKVVNTSPYSLSPATFADACLEIDEAYETYYNYDCSEATTIKTEKPESENESKTSKAYSVNSSQNYSIFDSAQLRAAVRAMTLAASDTKQFTVAVPQSCAVQSCQVTVAQPAELSAQNDVHAEIISALENAPDDYIFFKDNSVEPNPSRTYRYNAVNLSIISALQGSTATQWYATLENGDINYTRSMLLRVVSPVAFGLGTLEYTLSSLNVQNI